MPRQKLPDGWRESGCLDGTWVASPENRAALGVWGCAQKSTLCIENEDGIERIPASVALAVIRNAGLDPLLDMAKRVVAEPMVTIEERLSELARLIKSMEEP
jgi:hypothetical protein